jgi:hypothetical protein
MANLARENYFFQNLLPRFKIVCYSSPPVERDGKRRSESEVNCGVVGRGEMVVEVGSSRSEVEVVKSVFRK